MIWSRKMLENYMYLSVSTLSHWVIIYSWLVGVRFNTEYVGCNQRSQCTYQSSLCFTFGKERKNKHIIAQFREYVKMHFLSLQRRQLIISDGIWNTPSLKLPNSFGTLLPQVHLTVSYKGRTTSHSKWQNKNITFIAWSIISVSS